jgi:hypothetical protein
MLKKMQDVQPLTSLNTEITPPAVCAWVAEQFGVKQTEVGLLKLGGTLLHFLHPAALTTAGAIPIASSSVAALTARTQQAKIFNNFANVNHFSVFELVKLGDNGTEEQVIQKLMSAPVLAQDGKVVGVIQVSRKASRLSAAGPDFTEGDLGKLEEVGRAIGKLMSAL